MRKIFKIVEKIVWALVIIAIIIVFVLVAIGIIAKADNVWDRINPYIPYLYLIAAIFVAFKGVILIVQMHYESKIENGTMHLKKIIEELRAQQIVQEQQTSDKLDRLVKDISSLKNSDNPKDIDNIVSTLKEAITDSSDQKLALRRQELELACIIHTIPLRKRQMAMHQPKHSDDDAECSNPYFQRGRASIRLRCCQFALAVGIV